MNLRRVGVQVEVFNSDVDKLAHPRRRSATRLILEPRRTRAIDGLDQTLNFGSIQTIDAAPAPGGRHERKLASDVLDNVLGLAVAELVLTPQPRSLADDRGGANLRVRDR